MDTQIINSFDKATLIKIAHGLIYAAAVPAVLGILTYIGSLQISNPVFALVVAYLVPTLINIVKEYKAGI